MKRRKRKIVYVKHLGETRIRQVELTPQYTRRRIVTLIMVEDKLMWVDNGLWDWECVGEVEIKGWGSKMYI
jgi:hypothetical protein